MKFYEIRPGLLIQVERIVAIRVQDLRVNYDDGTSEEWAIAVTLPEMRGLLKYLKNSITRTLNPMPDEAFLKDR